MSNEQAFPVIRHDVDFCVVGGGMAGLVAALAAARHGARVVLMHERPMLGGNASSEIRVHICGADRHNQIPNLRETGILEELRLENLRRNPQRSFSVWDTILYEKAKAEPNLTLLLNCSCVDAQMNAGRIESVTGWQMTTQTRHEVRAKIFADCSGDAVLAPLSGAEFRVGREGRDEFGESLAPEKADCCTMGMTCCFGAREHETAQPFEPPAWAHRFDHCEDLPFGKGDHHWFRQGYWWIELGGAHDSIADTETLRDELLKITLGVWDHVKNRCPQKHLAARFALDWLQFLPGKRESRRYVGEHMLCQKDIDAEGRFDDRVAYGGWTMDDHHPEGFWAVKLGKPATHWHRSPSPYGIPYRSLYSRNVPNLMFAGRCASATHMAMSSTRVMGTGCSMGQAVGTAAAMATRLGVDPSGILPHVKELQQALLYDDCYLPWIPQSLPELTRGARFASSQGDPGPLRDGVNRPVGNDLHCWVHRAGDHVEYRFDSPREVKQVTLVLDSGLDLQVQMSYFQGDDQLTYPPPPLPRAFRLDVLSDGEWSPLCDIADNHQRLIRLSVGKKVEGVRYTLVRTWGAEESKLFAFYVE